MCDASRFGEVISNLLLNHGNTAMQRIRMGLKQMTMKAKTNAKRDVWTLIAVAAVATMALTAPSAAFAKTVNISGTHSRQEIATACKAVNGEANNTSGTSGSYGCDNLNKGTSVNCNAKGVCTGWVPTIAIRKQTHANPSQILTNTAE